MVITKKKLLRVGNGHHQEYIMLKQRNVQPCTCVGLSIGMGGLHGNQFAKNNPAKIS